MQSSAQFEILGCEEKVAKLQSQIVNSPARLRTVRFADVVRGRLCLCGCGPCCVCITPVRACGAPEQELKTLAQQLEDDRTAVDGVERQRRSKQARLEAVKQSQRDVDAVTAQLDEVGEEYKMYKDVVREVRGKQSTIEQCEGDMATLDAKKQVRTARVACNAAAPSRRSCVARRPSSLQHLGALMRKLQDKVKAFRPDSELQTSVSKEAVADARRELEALQSELADARQQRAAARARKAAIAKKVRLPARRGGVGVRQEAHV